MDSNLLTVMGIVVSIVLFFVGYKQTIGAKKERILNCNLEIEKILIRRIIIEKYMPTVFDITRLIEGKARDYKIKENDLLLPSQILNSIYTHILETDFITQEQRNDIINLLTKVIDKIEENPKMEFEYTRIKNGQKKKNAYQFVQIATMGIVASIAGTIAVLLPRIKEFDSSYFDIRSLDTAIMVPLFTSILLIFLITIFQKLKESQQKVTISNSSEALESAINFEKAVSKIIEKHFMSVKPSESSDYGYDFLIEKNDKKVFVEVKSWNKPVPPGVISRVVNMINHTVVNQGGSEGILISKYPVDYDDKHLEGKNVKIMTLNQFERYIKTL